MTITHERSASSKKLSAHLLTHQESEEGNYLTVIGISGHKYADVHALAKDISFALGASVEIVEYSGVFVQWKYSVRKFFERFTKWIFV